MSAEARKYREDLDATPWDMPRQIAGLKISTVNKFIKLLHTDPEILPGVPTNEQLVIQIDQSNRPFRFERALSPGERTGFLEMWRLTYVRETMTRLETDDLQALNAEARTELYDPELLASRLDDVRFIVSTAGQALAARRYQVEEQAIE